MALDVTFKSVQGMMSPAQLENIKRRASRFARDVTIIGRAELNNNGPFIMLTSRTK